MKRFFYLLISMLLGYWVWAHWLKPNSGVMDAPNYREVNEQVKTFDGFTMTNLSVLEGEFRVLSRENYSVGREAEISPVDFALGWGKMAEPEIYKQLSIRQSNRWYYWRYHLSMLEKLQHTVQICTSFLPIKKLQNKSLKWIRMI